MQRERRRAGRAIRKARREQREAFEAVATLDLSAMFAEISAAVERVAAEFANVVRVIVMDFARASAPLMAYYRLAVFESEQQAFRNRLAFRALEPLRRPHADHVTVEAWPLDCIEGECDHVTEEGEGDLGLCSPTNFAACVDCMDEKGAGRDEEGWEDWPLEAWPHPGSSGWMETPPTMADAA
ncbi:hypothetical protein [Microbacterium sp. VKM Ac-2923]|uniref:hypothetical protein n=1 Tax=Microbacterium sp. VKM Ac-2923 TaxID=2929476 RepID=UPI001FB4EB6D|nr:hypothetical protein [Microbacterium sp. VKM Ac-2923]MCJ1709262.1 hypothetical protein [Microbacterium sp. VKM Ac-2923]